MDRRRRAANSRLSRSKNSNLKSSRAAHELEFCWPDSMFTEFFWPSSTQNLLRSLRIQSFAGVDSGRGACRRRLPTLEISPPFARRISYETRLLLPGFRISGDGLTKFSVC